MTQPAFVASAASLLVGPLLALRDDSLRVLPEQTQPDAHYTILARDGSEADVAFARRWLDVAEQLMATNITWPANGIDTNQSGQNRCCETDA